MVLCAASDAAASESWNAPLKHFNSWNVLGLIVKVNVVSNCFNSCKYQYRFYRGEIC